MLSVFLGLLTGLCLFFAGIWLLRRGLGGMAGGAVRRILGRVAGSSLSACFWGCFVTAVIQSSSAVTVMTVGLTSAGVLELYQAFGIVVGANVGTTVTAQLISLRAEFLWPFSLGSGLLLLAVSSVIARTGSWNTGRLAAAGYLLLGFGLILCGIGAMESSCGRIRDVEWIYRALALSSRNPVFAVIVGAAFTGIIQSSSATTAIVMTLSRGGLVGVGGGIALVLGSNIGTCVTTLLSGTVAAPEGKAVAMAHFLFNLFGVLLVLPFFGPFAGIVSLTSSDPARQIANAHLLFNIISALAILPFIGPVTHVLAGIYRRKQ